MKKFEPEANQIKRMQDRVEGDDARRLTGYYFSGPFANVQEEMKKIIVSPPYNISQDQTEDFVDLFFKQETSIQNKIREEVSGCFTKGMSPADCAQFLLKKYFKKVFANHFANDDVNAVESPVQESYVDSELAVGDKVTAKQQIDDKIKPGDSGTIVDVQYYDGVLADCCVNWNRDIDGHNCEGLCGYGHGWWVYPDTLAKVPDKPNYGGRRVRKFNEEIEWPWKRDRTYNTEKLIPYHDAINDIQEGDFIVFESTNRTNDFSPLGLTGGARPGHYQKYVVRSVGRINDLPYHLDLQNVDNNSTTMWFLHDMVADNNTYVTKRTFYAPEPMTFRVWVEKGETDINNRYNREYRRNEKNRKRHNRNIMSESKFTKNGWEDPWKRMENVFKEGDLVQVKEDLLPKSFHKNRYELASQREGEIGEVVFVESIYRSSHEHNFGYEYLVKFPTAVHNTLTRTSLADDYNQWFLPWHLEKVDLGQMYGGRAR